MTDTASAAGRQHASADVAPELFDDLAVDEPAIDADSETGVDSHW